MGKVSENRHWMTGRQVVTGGAVSALTSQATRIYCICDGVRRMRMKRSTLHNPDVVLMAVDVY